MKESSTPLSRQISRWKRQADSGDLPDEIYDLIALGSEGIERKQITNLARVSRVVDDEGEIRRYNDFKHDWSYQKSIYGKTEKNPDAECGLCGKKHIVENCVLRDHKAQKEFVVGSSCVNRYIEITVNGRILEGDEKEKWVRDNMTEAKKQFRKQKFAQDWPSAMQDLKRFEPMMKEARGRAYSKWGSKIRWVRPELARLHRTVSKRIVSHGYLGAKTNKQWGDFMEVAESQFQIWEQEQARLAKIAEQRRIEAEERRRKAAQEIAKKRSEWEKQGNDFEDLTKEWIKDQDGWSQQMRLRVIQRIKNQGDHRLTGGFKAFYDKARHEIKSIEDTSDLLPIPISEGRDQPIPTKRVIALPEAIHRRHHVVKYQILWNHKEKLNSWELGFCESIEKWLFGMRNLTPAQEKSYFKICKKLGLDPDPRHPELGEI